jgi:hypothetical protein
MATYLAGKKATCTINGVAMAVEDGSYEASAGVDEVTNLNSGGFYEDIPTIKRATCSIRCVYDGDDPPDFDEGDLVALVIDVPAVAADAGPPVVEAVPRGPGISGNFRITRMSYPIVNPKAAVKYSFDANSNGAYVKTMAPVPEP